MYLYDTSGIYLLTKAVQVVDSIAAYSTSQIQDNYMINNWTYDTTSTFKGRTLTASERVNSSKTNTTTYGYNDEGCLLTEKDPEGNLTTYVVDNRGLVNKIINPTKQYTIKQYDADGNLFRESNYELDGDPLGTTRTYTDLSGRDFL